MSSVKVQNALRKVADGWWDDVTSTVSNTWDNFNNGTYGEQFIDKIAPASNDPWYHKLIGAGTNQKLKEIYRNNKALFNWGGLGLGAMGLYGLGSLLFDDDDEDEKGRRRSSGWSRLAKILGVGALVGGGGYLLSKYFGGANNQPGAGNGKSDGSGKQEPGFFSKAWNVVSPGKNAERIYEWAAKAVPETVQGVDQTVAEGIQQHGGVLNYMSHLDRTYNPIHSISPWRIYDYFQSGEAARQGKAIVDAGGGMAASLRNWGKGIYQTAKEGMEADARTIKNEENIRRTEALNRRKLAQQAQEADKKRQQQETSAAAKRQWQQRQERLQRQERERRNDAAAQQAVKNHWTPMDYRDKVVRGAVDHLMKMQEVDNPIEDHMTNMKYDMTMGTQPIDDEYYEVMRRTRKATDAADARGTAADALSKKFKSMYSISLPDGQRTNVFTGKPL